MGQRVWADPGARLERVTEPPIQHGGATSLGFDSSVKPSKTLRGGAAAAL